jgi:hypothetical protein
MGVYVPRLVSPLTGVEEAARTDTAYVFAATDANMRHWRRWWWFANIEQLLTFVLVTIVTICFTSMLAHSTLFDVENLPQSVAFLEIEGGSSNNGRPLVRGAVLGSGAFSLFASSMGITDYTSRLAADVLNDVSAFVIGIGEPAVFRTGLASRGDRVRGTPPWSGSTARPPRNLRLRGWDDDEPVFVAASDAQPEAPAGGDQGAVVSGRRIDLVDGVLRPPGCADHLAATSSTALR